MAQILRALLVVALAGFGAWMGTDLRAQEEETSPTAAISRSRRTNGLPS